MAGLTGPAGVEERGKGTRGVPRNLGGPTVSTEDSRREHRVTNSRPTVLRLGPLGTNGRRYSGIAERRQPSEARGTVGSRSVP